SFFFACPYTAVFYTLSLHDALPICFQFVCYACLDPANALVCYVAYYGDGDRYERKQAHAACGGRSGADRAAGGRMHRAAIMRARSEEHTSELQSRENLVCRLLLEKK